jgi:hypothetical protein
MDHASLHYFCARQSDFVGSELSFGHHRDFGGDGMFGSYTAILSAGPKPAQFAACSRSSAPHFLPEKLTTDRRRSMNGPPGIGVTGLV